jgi:catechol 2,3-dioxygenase-like lactoylglutathione lyase family enzyme
VSLFVRRQNTEKPENAKGSTVRMLRSIPAMPVKDIGRSVEFYRDKLGFTLVHQEAAFAIFRRDAAEIHLWAASDEAWRTRGGSSPVVSGAQSFIAGTARSDQLYGNGNDEFVYHPRIRGE